MTDQELINCHIWISANLVSKFIGQFPHVENEGDELFSIGVEQIATTITSREFPAATVGAICQVRCRSAMEIYLNSLQSLVSVSRSQRYRNRKTGRRTPKHVFCTEYSDNDTHTEIEIRDAADALGLDTDNLSKSDRRNLWNKMQ